MAWLALRGHAAEAEKPLATSLPAKVTKPAGVSIDPGLRAYIQKHCVDCHGPDKQESELRLDSATLDNAALDFRNPETATRWETVLERIEAGEMPPPKRPQPTAAETTHAASWISSQLKAAQARAAHGSRDVVPRRLNRLEYQNTVNELLGIDLDLAGYLPEDGTLAGFDKVGAALSISPVLIERYLEAADAALDEALIEKPYVPSTTTRYTLWDCGICRRTFVKNGIWADREDAVIVWYTNDKFFYVEPFQAPARGKYRVRVSAYSTLLPEDAEPDGKPVQLALHGGNFRPGGRGAHLVDFFTMEHERPHVFEAVDLIDVGHTFKVTIAGRPPKIYDVTKFSGPALAVQWIEIEGPLDTGAVEKRRELLFGSIDPSKATAADADRLLLRFAARAFRRPVTDAEVAPYLALTHAALNNGAGFVQALKVGMQTLLCAPEFLFLDYRPAPLDDYALASRLSYFLWCGPPDEELLRLAASKQLHDPKVRRRQVERMLADERSSVFTRHFLDGWLELKKIDFTTPDRELYPEFDEPLKDAMLRETRAFFDELLRHDQSVLNVIDSDFAMLNERSARHYGIAGVAGSEVRKVQLPADCPRGGMLTQASVLKVTADGTVTSPVLRGVWLLDRIMGKPVPPPPPGVPGVEPDIRGATTIRQLLAKHRQVSSCASCHTKIDPAGFALENFDPIGGWRDHYRVIDPKLTTVIYGRETPKFAHGPKVDAGDKLADGREFKDIRQFKQLLLSDPDAIVEGVAEKLLTYALGREPDFADRDELRKIVEGSKSYNRGLRSLIKELVASEIFAGK